MRKVLIILCITLALSACSGRNVDVISPFQHPLFVTEEDIVELNLDEFKYVENEDTLAYWRQKSEHQEDVFASFTQIFTEKDARSPTNAIIIDVFGRIDKELAVQDFEVREMMNENIGSNFIKDYQNLGDHNFFYNMQDDDEYLAYLTIQYENFIIEIQAVSIKNIDSANEQVSAFAKLFLEKIKKYNKAN